MTSPPRRALTPYELRREGWKALTERLGISGAIRFLMQYDPGYGDYTTERRLLFEDMTVDDAIQQMRESER